MASEVPDEMWAMIDRMREVVSQVWEQGYAAGMFDYEHEEFSKNPYEGKESLAKVFEMLDPAPKYATGGPIEKREGDQVPMVLEHPAPYVISRSVQRRLDAMESLEKLNEDRP